MMINYNGEASVFYTSDIIDKINSDNYKFYEERKDSSILKRKS
jgi:hypothetical protein